MKEEYKECPNCHNMVDKTDKECPYCLYSFWFTNSNSWNNIFDSVGNNEQWWAPTSFWDLIKSYQQWGKPLDRKEMKKQVNIYLIIFVIIFRLLPTLVWILSSIISEFSR